MHSALKVDAAPNSAEHFVAGAEDAIEQAELEVKELENALLGPVFVFSRFTTVTSIFWP